MKVREPGVAGETGPTERVIKRYENRKLYDPQGRRHVTLEDLAGMTTEGEEVRVVDRRSGEDVTAVVLAQVILEGIRERTARIPRQALSRLIRLAWRPASAWRGWVSPQRAAARARDEAERIVTGLLGRGRLTLEEGMALKQEVSRSVHRIVAEAQRGLESRVRALLEKSEREAGVSPVLQTLKERLMAFEDTLERPKTSRKTLGRKPRPQGSGRETRKKRRR